MSRIHTGGFCSALVARPAAPANQANCQWAESTVTVTQPENENGCPSSRPGAGRSTTFLYSHSLSKTDDESTRDAVTARRSDAVAESQAIIKQYASETVVSPRESSHKSTQQNILCECPLI